VNRCTNSTWLHSYVAYKSDGQRVDSVTKMQITQECTGMVHRVGPSSSKGKIYKEAKEHAE
jgi:hypothetical protein